MDWIVWTTPFIFVPMRCIRIFTACGTNDESDNGQEETFTIIFVQAGYFLLLSGWGFAVGVTANVVIKVLLMQ